MNKLKRLAIFGSMVLSFSLAIPSFNVYARPRALHAPTLGNAQSFVILSATGVTEADPANTHITGNVASSGGGAGIGIDCASMVAGTIYSTDAAGPACATHNSTLPGMAQADNLSAFGDLVAGDNAPAGCTSIPVELGGHSYGPGIYCSGGVFTLNGTLTLAGSTGVWIFQSASTLTTVGAAAQVVGGDPCNVWWRLPSDTAAAVIGSGSSMVGNILALGSITFGSGATLSGRALSQIGDVTLIGNTITAPVCSAVPTNTPTGGGGPGLPDTGGAAIRNSAEEFPWSTILVIVGIFSAIALIWAVRKYRPTNLPK